MSVRYVNVTMGTWLCEKVGVTYVYGSVVTWLCESVGVRYSGSITRNGMSMTG